MKRVLVLAFLLAPSVAHAQAPATYTLRVYNQGQATPVQTTSAPASATTCNLAPSATSTAPVVNPRIVEWDDPANVGRVCRLDLASFFGGLPVFATQTATLSVTDDLGQVSDESNQSNPFVRAVPPTALRNLRVVRGGGL